MKRSIRVWVLGILVAGAVSFGVVAATSSTSSFGTTNNVLELSLIHI